MQTIGIVGLGMMGRPMAERLHRAGYPLIVQDARQTLAQAFAATHAGAVAAGSFEDFDACEVVITMLPDSDAVDAVVIGSEGQPGLVATMKTGALLIDMGSSQPVRTRALARTIEAAGKRFIDAPVSGGVKRAIDGTLAIMIGGDVDLFDAQRTLFGHLGTTIIHVGPAGAGHAMKALNNYVSAAGLVAAAEALHAGRRFGLDPDLMTDVFNSSTGRNNTTENKIKPFMLSGRFDSGFSAALMAKDLGTAVSLGDWVGTPMGLGNKVLTMWQAASDALGPGADHTEMYRWLAPERDPRRS